MNQKYSNDQLEDVRGLIEILDSNWVDRRVRKFTEEQKRPKKIGDRGKNFDPLTVALGTVVPNLEQPQGDTSKANLLHAIAKDVVLVVHSGCAHSSERVEELKSGNRNKVNSTIYEFEVAALLISKGHKVDFIAEGKDKTPDFLVNDSIEVECKQRGETKIEKYQAKIFEELHASVEKIFAKKKFSAMVEIFTSTELINRNEINKIRKQLRGLEPNIEYQHREGDTIVHVRPVRTFQRGIGIQANPPQPGFASRFHRVQMAFSRAAPTDTGFFLECIFGGLTLKGREEGITASLKTAKKQLSAKRPAIAFIDLKFPVRNPAEIDFRPVLHVVEDFMRQNSSFSAVIVTTQVEVEVAGKRSQQQHILKFTHREPKHPLPDTFAFPP